MENIKKIAYSLSLEESDLVLYGDYKAKIKYDKIKEILESSPRAKTVLVTAITPTPQGEGKTLTSIGLADALSLMNKNPVLCLREPSLGPVFGVKGGATGSGKAQIVPADDINLHFTGDIHAVSAANNLIAALIDNHIFQGNELGIREVVWKRCVDMNDRTLRTIQTDNGERSFCITAASEIMAILCLSRSIEELRSRIYNIIIGYDVSGRAIFFGQLKAVGAVVKLLKDAICPNLVQTLDGTPAFVHGGPFANIAHGCNSILATMLAQRLGDVVITEAGFGADLGAEKFIDIASRYMDTDVDCIVLVATLRALRHHGNGDLEKGFSNLEAHIENLKKTNVPVVVAINSFSDDSAADTSWLRNRLDSMGIPNDTSKAYSTRGGASGVANLVVKVLESKHFMKRYYEINDTLKEKIEKLAFNVYGAGSVRFSDRAESKLELYRLLETPVCMAKTQLSISDNKKLLGAPKDYELNITDLNYYAGAGFVVAYAGDIIDMPGLPKTPAAEDYRWEV